MARIGKLFLLFGVALSAFAVGGIVFIVGETYLPQLTFRTGRWDRSRHLLDIFSFLYIIAALWLAQSKRRPARIAVGIMAVGGYLSLLAFVAWLFEGA